MANIEKKVLLSIRKKRITFLDLPAELRNRIYSLSGCLEFYEDTKAHRARKTVAGDYTPAAHTHVHGCTHGANCKHANWTGFLDTWHRAFMLVNPRSPRASNKPGDKGVCSQMTPWRSSRRPEICHDATTAQPALTKVSKQIRSETLPIFYGNHPFVFRLLGRNVEQDAAQILEWLDLIGPIGAGFLRDIVIVHAQKRRLRWLARTFGPELKRRGVDVSDDVVEVKRLEYPFTQDDIPVVKHLRPR